MKTKVFIDGSAGTTGLRIVERMSGRADVELLTLPEEKRKDFDARAEMMNASDVTFLCLPDDAAKEIAAAAGETVRLIDASTAHRTAPGWQYGFPELSAEFREGIVSGNRVAVPGCHASGMIAILYPMVKAGILPPDYPVTIFSLTGYSGGGKKMIAEYETDGRPVTFEAPRAYGLNQNHKHLPEVTKVAGLSYPPCFTPVVSDYYAGMAVAAQFQGRLLRKTMTPESLHAFFSEYYAGQKLLSVAPFGAEAEEKGYLSGNLKEGWDGMELYITGNPERLMVTAVFDNLGKGASGAAVQCFNLMTGMPETYGLSL